ncbi:MAG: ABC transporter permease subunit [Chthonomonadales bacterium]|nr:ABC transporter permease subunit [Chthonomonadales bacterium]
MSTSQAPTVDPPGGASAVNPIADLSYRHYDGPLRTRAVRWWIVALLAIRGTIRKWWFWLLFLLASSSYGFWGLMLFLESRFGSDFRRMMFQTSQQDRFATSFFQAYDGSLFWLMVIGLVVGAPSIAGDNRAHALQVYLAKPITKTDYLLGKWAGVFALVFISAFLPALLLYCYCILAFWSEGIVRHEPWLIFRIVAASGATAAGLASLFVGISAWCRSTMVSAAISAGIYIATSAIAGILWGVLFFRAIQNGSMPLGSVIQHASISGVIKGVAWNIYGVALSIPNMGQGPMSGVTLRAPNGWIMGTALGVLIAVGLLAARLRIRAVEVVTG